MMSVINYQTMVFASLTGFCLSSGHGGLTSPIFKHSCFLTAEFSPARRKLWMNFTPKSWLSKKP